MNNEEKWTILLDRLKRDYAYSNRKHPYRPMVSSDVYLRGILDVLERYTDEDIKQYNTRQAEFTLWRAIHYSDVVRLLREHIVLEELSKP
jgi:hypothetical protein